MADMSISPPQVQAVFDFAPIARVMLLGMLIALGPLAWVWLRNRKAGLQQRLRALTLLTLFLTFDLVLFGAFTRLTDSGLGCPDWPGCYGTATPIGAMAQISAEQAAMPTGPVTHQKAWIEMIHRYLASGVGVLVAVLAAASWVQRRSNASASAYTNADTNADTNATGNRLHEKPAFSPWLPTLTFVWVCIQGAFGAFTVTMKLFPAIVTLHLLGGMVLLALLQMQVTKQRAANQGVTDQGISNPHATNHRAVQASSGLQLNLPARMWLALVIGYALLWVQIALGGWVSTNYAVLACTEFPMCQGQWVPPMAMSEGFEIWRELGLTGGGQNISFAALTAIHVVHRSFAFVLFAWLGWAAWRCWHVDGLQPSMRAVAALLALQLLTGLSNVVLGWPLLAAVAHTGGAAALVLVLTHALVKTRSYRQRLGADNTGLGRQTGQALVAQARHPSRHPISQPISQPTSQPASRPIH